MSTHLPKWTLYRDHFHYLCCPHLAPVGKILGQWSSFQEEQFKCIGRLITIWDDMVPDRSGILAGVLTCAICDSLKEKLVGR